MPSQSSDQQESPLHEDAGAVRNCLALLAELRLHCGRDAIRWMRYVEDALDDAVSIDPAEALPADGNAMRRKLGDVRRGGVARGFHLGVLAAMLAIQGILASDRPPTEADLKRFGLVRPAAGAQLKLFD